MDARELKARVVRELMAVKVSSGKTYGQIAAETGMTNVYAAQLLRRQARLHPESVAAMRTVLPQLPDDMVAEMTTPPVRSYDPNLIQDPTVYRLNEAIMHFGESIKEIINEEFGDGIMSAIDFFCSVDKVKGIHGEDRVVVTFDGKFLPYTEQISKAEPPIGVGASVEQCYKSASSSDVCWICNVCNKSLPELVALRPAVV